jgi:hypothetical protein
MYNGTSPDMSDNGVEALIQAKGKTAPRVTPDDIEANIASVHYFTALNGVRGVPGSNCYETAAEVPLSLLTFCVLVLQNGFIVVGESACASPENFDAEIGRSIARANAVAKMWPLMGYELKCRLHNQLSP